MRGQQGQEQQYVLGPLVWPQRLQYRTSDPLGFRNMRRIWVYGLRRTAQTWPSAHSYSRVCSLPHRNVGPCVTNLLKGLFTEVLRQKFGLRRAYQVPAFCSPVCFVEQTGGLSDRGDLPVI